MAGRLGNEEPLHRAGLALGEWLLRVLQRKTQGRVPQWRNLLQLEGGPNHHRKLAQSLQHQAPTLCAWLSPAGTARDRTKARPSGHHELISQCVWYKKIGQAKHTNNIWFAFDALVRVARPQVVIILPNVYHWSSRVRFFLGREMDKYVLPAHSIVDRHRWLPSYVSARHFCTERAAMHGRQGAGIFWRAADLSSRSASLQGVQQSG